MDRLVRQFELGSNDSEQFATPRLAGFKGYLEGDGRRDWAWITVDPPVPGQFLSRVEDVIDLVVVGRHDDNVLEKPGSWPAVVYICVAPEYFDFGKGTVRSGDLKTIAWGEVRPIKT